MPIFIGTKKVDKLFLGTKPIAKIFLGTSLVYDSSGSPTPPTPSGRTLVIYDANVDKLTLIDVDGLQTFMYSEAGHDYTQEDPRYWWIPGSYRNGDDTTFKRPPYRDLGYCDTSKVTTLGTLRLYILGYDSYANDQLHNDYFYCEPITNIPLNVTKMHVTIKRGPDPCYLMFGLIPSSSSNSMNDGGTGILTQQLTTTNGESTYTLDIPSGRISGILFPIINIIGSSKITSYFDIKKIWFDLP